MIRAIVLGGCLVLGGAATAMRHLPEKARPEEVWNSGARAVMERSQADLFTVIRAPRRASINQLWGVYDGLRGELTACRASALPRCEEARLIAMDLTVEAVRRAGGVSAYERILEACEGDRACVWRAVGGS